MTLSNLRLFLFMIAMLVAFAVAASAFFIIIFSAYLVTLW